MKSRTQEEGLTLTKRGPRLDKIQEARQRGRGKKQTLGVKRKHLWEITFLKGSIVSERRRQPFFLAEKAGLKLGIGEDPKVLRSQRNVDVSEGPTRLIRNQFVEDTETSLQNGCDTIIWNKSIHTKHLYIVCSLCSPLLCT